MKPGPAGDRAARVRRYLEWSAALPSKWGTRDCTLFAADWIVSRSGAKLDPGQGIRNTYSTRAEALAIVERHGGIEAFVDERLGALGIGRTDDPQDGDIGIVTVTGLAETGEMVTADIPAIRFGAMWAVRTESGVRVSRFQHKAAWRI